MGYILQATCKLVGAAMWPKLRDSRKRRYGMCACLREKSTWCMCRELGKEGTSGFENREIEEGGHQCK